MKSNGWKKRFQISDHQNFSLNTKNTWFCESWEVPIFIESLGQTEDKVESKMEETTPSILLRLCKEDTKIRFPCCFHNFGSGIGFSLT